MIRPVFRSTARIRSSWGGQERLELGREVDQAPFVVLRGPGLETQGSRLEVELATLEESLSWRTLLRLVEDREPHELPVLVGQAQHLGQRPELAPDGSADRCLLLASDNVGVDDGLPDCCDAPASEEAIQMLHAAGVLLQVARPRRLVARLEYLLSSLTCREIDRLKCLIDKSPLVSEPGFGHLDPRQHWDFAVKRSPGFQEYQRKRWIA